MVTTLPLFFLGILIFVVIITESKASVFCVCCAVSMLVAHRDKASTNFFIDCLFSVKAEILH